MKNLLKVVAVGISLVLLSGCASPFISPADVDRSAYKVDPSEKVSSNHKLSNDVTVETTGFLETTKVYIKRNSKSNLNDENAKKAIEKSLKAAGMFGGLSGDYTLKATLVDSDIGNIFSTRSYKRKMIINYKLINDISGEVIYDKTITGHGKGEFYIITFDHYGREQDVAEKAFKDNFRQLIEDLKSL